MMKKLTILLLVSALFFGCEEQPVEMLEIIVPPGDKTVLIEDFTGVSCPNCPEGARIIENLRTIYGKDRIIPVAVHTLGFHQLHDNSQYEFRTEKGQQMQDAIDVLFSKPAAAVNRTKNPEDGSRFYNVKERWPDAVAREIATPSELNMGLTLNYNKQSREVTIDITFVPVNDIDVQLNVTALITENGLIDPQTDISEVVQEYVHDHVLRDVITSPEGNPLGTFFTKGEVYETSMKYTIPEDNTLPWWNAENCEIIVFISEATTSSKRVLQTISAKVVE